MKVEAIVAGRPVEITTFDDWVSGIDARSILTGETYLIPPDLRDVHVVLDVGANVGASSALFASHFPDAEVHAFEPAPATFAMLAANVAPFDNVTTHPFGLSSTTEVVDLYRGAVGPGQASMYPGPSVTDQSDRVETRAAGSWLEESGLEQIDILKVDTEGGEVPILRSLGTALASVRILYAEFHSPADRRLIEDILDPTHTLAVSKQFFETGEVLYLRHDQVEELRGSITAAALLPSMSTSPEGQRPGRPRGSAI